jgi:small redox-active disulfide protein 2
MKMIEVLGPGCANCKKLAENAAAAVRELGLECEVEQITDMNVIIGYRVMLTPALAIDGVVKSSGRVLTVEQIKKILSEA